MTPVARSSCRRIVMTLASSAVFLFVVSVSAAAPKVQQEGASSNLSYGSVDLQVGWRRVPESQRGGGGMKIATGGSSEPVDLRVLPAQDPPPPPPQTTAMHLLLAKGDWFGSRNPPSALLAWQDSETGQSFGLRIFDTSRFPPQPPIEVSVTCGGACSQVSGGSGLDTFISGSKPEYTPREENHRDYCRMSFNRMSPDEVSGTLECQGIPNINDSSQVIDAFGTFLATQTPINELPRTDGGNEEALTTEAPAPDKPPVPLTVTAGLLVLAAAGGAGFVKFSVLAPAVGLIHAPSRSYDRNKTSRPSHGSCLTEWSAASRRSRPVTEGAAGKLESSANNIERVMAPVFSSLTEAAAAFSELVFVIDAKAAPRQQDARTTDERIQVIDRILDSAARLIEER